jgi:hypothetical protein
LDDPKQPWTKGAAGKLIQIPSLLDMYDVNEMFSRYYVDPTIAQKNIPNKWKVKISENGKAILLIMVQQCKKMILDGIFNVGSVGLSHLWIEIEGPPEVITPLPGTSRSLPTWYWYVTPHQLDDAWAASLCSLVGVPAKLDQHISLGGEPYETRFGEVIENKSIDAKYSWTEKIKRYPDPDIITGSHRLYGVFGGRETEAHVRCFTHFLGESEVSLIATPSSSVAKLGFGTSLSGFSNPVWFKHCTTKYKVGFL